MIDKHHIKVAWIALILTAGEFTGAIFLVVHEGHYFAIYLALTYMVRETSGGKHYHDIVIETFKKLREKKNAPSQSNNG